MSRDPWSYLSGGLKQSTDAAIRGTAGSIYKFFITFGVLGILFTLILVGIKIAVSSPSKRAEAFESLFWKAIIAIVLFSVTAIVPWVLRAVDAIA